MTAILEAQSLGKPTAARGAGRLHPGHPARARGRPGRPERRRASPRCSNSPAGCSPEQRQHQRARQRPRARAPSSWPASASSPRTPPCIPHLSVADHLQARRAPEPPLGPGLARTGAWPSSTWTRAEGRQALRRPARPTRPDHRGRQAARAAHPRRAGRQPRPARPPHVPQAPDGIRGGERHQRHPLLAPDLRPRTGLRLPDRARLLPRAAGRRVDQLSPPTTGSCAPVATPANCRRTRGDLAEHTDRQSTFVVRCDHPHRPGTGRGTPRAWKTWC
jgi:hypothetical protein